MFENLGGVPSTLGRLYKTTSPATMQRGINANQASLLTPSVMP